MAMTTEAHKKAKKKYKSKNELNKTVTFNRNTEKVLLEYISSIPKFGSYVKALIKKDMEDTKK